MIAKNIIDILNGLAPIHFAEKWDNVGLQLGSIDKEVNKVLISLDVSDKTVNLAIKNNVDMIITHHPFIFEGLKNISKDDKKGKILYNLIRADITLFSLHTNLDICPNGVSDRLGQIFRLKSMNILSPTISEKLFKLVVFVPKTHSDRVREAITRRGAGHIGNYSDCTFNINGLGTFKPSEVSNPFIGKIGELETVEEVRVETIVPESILKNVINAMKDAHPYEEVAYDIYPLANDFIKHGHGRIGNLENPITLLEFANEVKKKLDCREVRAYGDTNRIISKVAVCGGSGSDFIVEAAKHKADVYLTGDIKYHDAQLASELGLALIDAGHYDTEKHILEYLKNYLINSLGSKISIDVICENNYSFFTI
ncbi:Nif3-like dinuclear metal center hexameric protein [Sporosalibacterium faouarense]|uniref:Nif3-like dinuclear metal center hexameric protein n=1 Tax=Sporosalibacterium faouarense TaxID=516123 RepID=UPI00141C7F3E|nr:Nif3-like dinuclear metal center hexameric protein [Sporosalibacterium faouarense]MTI49431.1 Nif3-like dinuclear metal center hexameric protein [Bacillota bacterium]